MPNKFAAAVRNANPVAVYALATFATLALGGLVVLAWPVIFPAAHFVFANVVLPVLDYIVSGLRVL